MYVSFISTLSAVSIYYEHFKGLLHCYRGLSFFWVVLCSPCCEINWMLLLKAKKHATCYSEELEKTNKQCHRSMYPYQRGTEDGRLLALCKYRLVKGSKQRDKTGPAIGTIGLMMFAAHMYIHHRDTK